MGSALSTRWIAAAIVARRVVVDSVRVKAAEATNRTMSGGIARSGSSPPIAPVEIEMSTKRHVTRMAAAMRAIAPNRSIQGARLKNSHQTRMTAAPANPPRTP